MRRKASRTSRRLALLAAALALIGGLAFHRYALALQRDARPGGEPVDVVVAAADLPRGHVIAAGDLEIARMPEGFVPATAVGVAADAVGRALAAPIAEGELVTRSRLAPPGGPVAALVPHGLRAVALVTALPAGVLAPGDRVDVLATFAAPPHTETVVAGAEVLSVLAGDGTYDGAGVTLVLLVSSTDAERVAYARAFGDLSVAISPG